MESKVVRLFCHLCKKEFNQQNDNWGCVYCQGEFCEEINDNIEELKNFEPYNAISQPTNTQLVNPTIQINSQSIIQTLFSRLLPNMSFNMDQYMDEIVQFILQNSQPNETANPVSSQFLGTLKETKINNEQGIKTSDTMCIICNEEYKDEDVFLKLPCNHDFHKTCIIPWFAAKNTCPICRKEYPSESS